MALTAEQITALNFHDYHQMILPYLNGGGMGMKLLWENQNPTQNVASGDQASLSSDDYDLALYIAKRSTSDQRDAAVVTCAKGDNGLLSFGMSTIIYSRTFNVSGTTVTFGAGTAGNSTENSICIPYRIYGIKIYNREDKGNTYSTSERIVGTWIDGSPLYQKTIDFGALPNASSKNVSSGITDSIIIRDIKVICYGSDYTFSVPSVTGTESTDRVVNPFYVNATNEIRIITNSDYSAYSAYVTLCYTKNA